MPKYIQFKKISETNTKFGMADAIGKKRRRKWCEKEEFLLMMCVIMVRVRDEL